MFIGRMVDYQVDNQPHSASVNFTQQAVKISHRAKFRHDLLIIADVVAVIIIRRFVHRADPNQIDAEVFQVIEFFGDSVQVTNAVAVAVLKTARINLVGHRLFPPARHRLPPD